MKGGKTRVGFPWSRSDEMDDSVLYLTVHIPDIPVLLAFLTFHGCFTWCLFCLRGKGGVSFTRAMVDMHLLWASRDHCDFAKVDFSISSARGWRNHTS